MSMEDICGIRSAGIRTARESIHADNIHISVLVFIVLSPFVKRTSLRVSRRTRFVTINSTETVVSRIVVTVLAVHGIVLLS